MSNGILVDNYLCLLKKKGVYLIEILVVANRNKLLHFLNLEDKVDLKGRVML